MQLPSVVINVYQWNAQVKIIYFLVNTNNVITWLIHVIIIVWYSYCRWTECRLRTWPQRGFMRSIPPNRGQSSSPASESLAPPYLHRTSKHTQVRNLYSVSYVLLCASIGNLFKNCSQSCVLNDISKMMDYHNIIVILKSYFYSLSC